ncbi:MAG: LysE family translocator [Candidatus Promineifilaceae bacterium]
MFDTTQLLIFVAAGLALLLVPGPAVLYIVTRSIDQGRLAGLVSVLGVGVGTMFHVAAAALGLSALLVSSALLFNIVKLLGAGYLIYLGLRKLFVDEELAQPEEVEPTTLGRIFYQGVLVNILNPKTALFFFAFLPQFADPARGAVALQIFILGVILVSMGLVTDGSYAVLAGTAGNWLKGNLRVLRAQRYFAGTVYVALGMVTAFSHKD